MALFLGVPVLLGAFSKEAQFEPYTGNTTVVMVRILGNDAPPYTDNNQTLRNLLTSVLHEEPPSVDGLVVKQIWMLNRVLDRAKRQHLVDVMRRRGLHHVVHDIDFKEDCKRKTFLQSPSTIITAQNVARNEALHIAALHDARWVIPLDGNQFLTGDFWARLERAIRFAETLRYDTILIPMIRLRSENVTVSLQDRYAIEEPQVAMRTPKGRPFDESKVYGLGNKLSLLQQRCRQGRALCCRIKDVFDITRFPEAAVPVERIPRNCPITARLLPQPLRVFSNNARKTPRKLQQWRFNARKQAVKRLDAQAKLLCNFNAKWWWSS